MKPYWLQKEVEAIKFALSDIREIGKIGQSYEAIKLDKDDEVVSMNLGSEGKYLLIISEFGFGKRTASSQYKIQNRGGKRSKLIKLLKKQVLLFLQK